MVIYYQQYKSNIILVFKDEVEKLQFHNTVQTQKDLDKSGLHISIYFIYYELAGTNTVGVKCNISGFKTFHHSNMTMLLLKTTFSALCVWLSLKRQFPTGLFLRNLGGGGGGLGYILADAIMQQCRLFFLQPTKPPLQSVWWWRNCSGRVGGRRFFSIFPNQIGLDKNMAHIRGWEQTVGKSCTYIKQKNVWYQITKSTKSLIRCLRIPEQ